MEVTKQTVRDLYHGHKAVGTTPTLLTSLQFPVYKGVLLRANAANIAPIWVGGRGVTADSAETTGGVPLSPGDSITIPVELITAVYLVSTDANQDISWIGI